MASVPWLRFLQKKNSRRESFGSWRPMALTLRMWIVERKPSTLANDIWTVRNQSVSHWWSKNPRLGHAGGGVFEAVDMMEKSLVGSSRSWGISKAIQVYIYIYIESIYKCIHVLYYTYIYTNTHRDYRETNLDHSFFWKYLVDSGLKKSDHWSLEENCDADNLMCCESCERHGFIFDSYTFPLHLAVQQLLVCQWRVEGCPTPLLHKQSFELGTFLPCHLQSMRAHLILPAWCRLTVALSGCVSSLFGWFFRSEDGPSRTGPFQENEFISMIWGVWIPNQQPTHDGLLKSRVNFLHPKAVSLCRGFQVSSDPNPAYLLYIGDYSTQLYRGHK